MPAPLSAAERSDRDLDELMAKYRRWRALGPFRTPEEAEAAYDAAPDEPLPEGTIREMVKRITQTDEI